MRNILACIIVALIAIPSEGGEPVRKTVAEFLKMSPDDTTFCELTGLVSRVRNYQHGRLFLDDETGSVLIYNVYDARTKRYFPEIDVREGDSLTVMGHRFVYDNRIIEMKNALYVRHIEGPDHANVAKVDRIDKNPSFKGKDVSEFSKWVTKHLVYPKEAVSGYADGTVVASFIVGRDGSVLEPKIIKSVHPALDAEVIRVLKNSPKWKPGEVDNHPVRVTYTIPIIFSMDM